MNLRLVSLTLAALPAFAVPPALTIYNQNFAVVRETVPLDLKPGANTVRWGNVTAHVEPSSVILRDPAGKMKLSIREQNYRNDAASEARLLALHEGKTIEFEVDQPGGQKKIVPGKIIRSGPADPPAGMPPPYFNYAVPAAPAPIIETEGKLRFHLPGRPLFPALGDEALLKPELSWQIDAAEAAKLDAELAYVTGGMNWEADYNVIAPAEGDALEAIGWVTIANRTGKTFPDAQLKLMAGDVSKVQPRSDGSWDRGISGPYSTSGRVNVPPVTERTFDEYHLYTLARATTLRDAETKQVEFLRASPIASQRLYVYDGAKIEHERYRGHNLEHLRTESSYGTVSNPKVWVMREFKNSVANGLGIPLPKGRVRFYRRDAAASQLEFTGENVIDHTPRDETVRVFTGAAFDLVGERRRTHWKLEHSSSADESFAIKLRNRKKEPVEIRVVEHLYRWPTSEITEKSHTFLKTDAQTIEFRVQLAPDEEKTVTYTVHYSW